jgi:hypothetical protein
VRAIKPFIFSILFLLAAVCLRAQTHTTQTKASDTLKIDTLKATIVTAKLRPHNKGDTMEFNTQNIRLRLHGDVEELLAQLPGLHIDPDGTIIYNGEKIQHLLVDGEDIFGSNPAMVTRNFDGSKIARVQILDRKSDQSLFTGIDDGTRTKTLNLVLKESARDGYFGKVDVGGNTGGYYNADGALAAFRKKEQFTFLGLTSNTGTTGFSSNTGGSSSSINFLNGTTDALGASAGTGIPRFEAAALHYANSWNTPDDHLVANYQFSHFYTQPVTATQSLQTQPDSVYAQFQQARSINQQLQNWAYGIYDWAPDNRTAFHVVFHARNSQAQNQLDATAISTFNDTLVNSSLRTIRDNVNLQNIGGSVSWRTRIGSRPDHIFSINVGATKIDATTNGYLYSVARFYQPGGMIQTIDTIDQRKQIASHSWDATGSLSYTQPLWKGAKLGLSYDLYYIGDNPLQATFNRGDGKYEQLVDSLSSQLKTQTINHRATVVLEGNTGRFSYTLGNDWLGYSYHQQDQLTDSLFHLHYSNWTPRILLNYAASQATRLRFDYEASTQTPTPAQLAPVTNNNNPLHITLGNPNLKPGLSQSRRLEFNRFTNWIINLSAGISLISNSISTRITTDSLGRQISQPVNVDGGGTTQLNFSVNRKFGDFDLGFYSASTYSRSVNYVNDDLSQNDAFTTSSGLSLNRYVQDKYGLQFSTNFTWLDQTSSINPATPIRYWTQNHSGSVTLFLIPGFELNTNATYTWQQKTSAFTGNTCVLLWNTYIGHNFFDNRFVAKFQFNNILNANAGITRANALNTYTQTSTNILGRYWMLSAAWHFDKKFKHK